MGHNIHFVRRRLGGGYGRRPSRRSLVGPSGGRRRSSSSSSSLLLLLLGAKAAAASCFAILLLKVPAAAEALVVPPSAVPLQPHGMHHRPLLRSAYYPAAQTRSRLGLPSSPAELSFRSSSLSSAALRSPEGEDDDLSHVTAAWMARTAAAAADTEASMSATRSPLFRSSSLSDLDVGHGRRRARGRHILRTAGKIAAYALLGVLSPLGSRPAWAAAAASAAGESSVPLLSPRGRAAALASTLAASLTTLASSLPSRASTLAKRYSSPFAALVANPSRSTLRAVVKPTLLTLAAIMVLNTVMDVIRTRQRQSLDATSEWGRYADDPAARGRALFSLCLRIVPYVAADAALKRVPGGKLAEELEEEEEEMAKDSGKKGKGRRRKKKKKKKKKKKSTPTASSTDGSGPESEKTWAARRRSRLRASSGLYFADGLLRLGPLYVKIGQILSCRQNLFPSAWIAAMERLQDRVPAKSGDDALRLAYEAVPGGKLAFWDIFAEFDDVPLAAASLGQVHRAALNDGNNTVVAVKIQRERLRDIYDKDLALMRKIATVVDTVADKMGGMGQVGGVRQSWTDIFNDAEEILYREIDYRDEADNAVKFASDFGLGRGGKAIPTTASSLDGKPLPSASQWLRTPYTYRELSSEKLLVMEYVPSIKASDDKALSEAGVTKEDKEYLAECLGRAYLRQFCCHRFFSTDPHPGNLGVEASPSPDQWPRLVFYDFGQACALRPDQARGVLEAIEGIVDTNADECVSAFDRMGVLVDGADLEKVRKKVRKNFETGKVKAKRRVSRMGTKRGTTGRGGAAESSSESMKHISSSGDEGVLSSVGVNGAKGATTATSKRIENSPDIDEEDDDDSEDPEVMEYFILPAEYAFVARAISQMDGVGRGLDPQFDFISASAPHLVEIKGPANYLLDEAKKRVYGWERRAVEWQRDLFGKFGFDPSLYRKSGGEDEEASGSAGQRREDEVVEGERGDTLWKAMTEA